MTDTVDIARGRIMAAASSLFAAAGPQRAEFIGALLLEAEGLGRPQFGFALLNEAPRPLRLLPHGPCGTSARLELDAADIFPPAAVAHAIDVGSAAASDHDAAVVAMRSLGKLGRLAPYVGELARRGFISLLAMTSTAAVTPFGGHRAAFGTNPIAAAIPTATEPVIIDTASSSITMAHWEEAKRLGRPLPEGAAVDATGAPTTDPHQAVALTPRGGLVGTSLALIVDILATGTTGIAGSRTDTRGAMLVVIRPGGSAADTGEDLKARLLAAGGHVPGQVPQPGPLAQVSRTGLAAFNAALAAADLPTVG